MPPRGLWSYVRGYVIIRVTGSGLERWLNAATRRGITLWTVSRPLVDTLILRVGWSDFTRLRGLAAGDVHLRILGRYGLPVWLAKLRRRRSLVLGALGCALLAYWAASVVWFVHVQAPPGVDPSRIREVAARAGLQPGQRIAHVRPEAVERTIYLELPQVGWVDVDFRGTRALIQVAERPGWNEGEARYGHIVADRDGLILQVVALRGEPVVQVGDTVSRGQVLISGLLPPGELYARRLESGDLPYLRADGRVYARVWYEAYGEADREEVVHRPTGRQERVDVVSLGSYRLHWGPLESRFSVYRERRIVREPESAFPWLPSLRWETIWREEFAVERRPRSEREAQAEAVRQARAVIDAQRKVDSETIHEQVEPAPRPGFDGVRVRVLVEAREQIGVFQPIGNDTALSRQ